MVEEDGLGVWGMFRQRMEREGRREELDRRRQGHLDAGVHPRKATRLAMHEMGFVSGPDEIEQHWAFRVTQKVKEPHESPPVVLASGAFDENRSRSTWNAAMRLLPNTAALTVELDWIGAHPAMSQRVLGSEPDDAIVTVDDVLCPSHGRAPSKRAVNQLLHWVHKPGDFFKGLLAGRKKTAEGEGGAGAAAVKDMGLEEARRILEQMEGKP